VIGERGPLRAAANLAWLALILLGTFASLPGPPPALAVVAAVVGGGGWVLLVLAPGGPWWRPLLGILAAGAGGATLMATTHTATPFTLCVLATLVAGTRLPVAPAAGVTTAIAVTVAAARLSAGVAVTAVLVLLLVAVLLFGMARRESARRAEQRELAGAATARANEEHARAAALAERARIARDVHDVLAHSLSALSVQLQGARLMLLRDGAAPDTVAQVERAQRLATDGLVEARRAVAALRTEPVDVAEGLRALVADTPGASLEIDGEPDVLPAAARETLLRTAQEALTNARKHAPGAEVRVRLARGGTGTELVVQDSGGPPPPRRPGGHGLVGMAERAALAGAELEAGPAEDGWQVRLRVPDGGEVRPCAR
jgi:signal transduction histidine kinase